MQADPLSRAIALHGLGKITIHEGEFKKGLHLMEESADTYPTALAYRNLAVYWNSEYEFEKGNFYTQKALAMNPTDPYNLVFAAVFMAMAGKKDEALKDRDGKHQPAAGVIQSRRDLCPDRAKGQGALRCSNVTFISTSVITPFVKKR